jgi:transcriptional regulator with XRE-family HTH domain
MTITEQLRDIIATATICAGKLPHVGRVNERTIRDILRGKANPTAKTAERIAAALGMRWQLVKIEEEQP